MTVRALTPENVMFMRHRLHRLARLLDEAAENLEWDEVATDTKGWWFKVVALADRVAAALNEYETEKEGRV